jgi:peptide-methionine (S)-S-oxide reductase
MFFPKQVGQIAAAVLVGLAFAGCDMAMEAGNPVGSADNKGESTMATATFAAGCFWGVEETFRNVEGVTSTTVGYTGGWAENPTYEQVCAKGTGHAEAVQVEYDTAKVSYDDLLEVFWNCHDPTTKNRQGPDVGAQYRSAIFYHSPGQQAAAEASKAKLDASGTHKDAVVTEIVPATTFWRAEDYHQQYLAKRGLSHCGLN